jgi:DNA-binding transcriptional LysR family regulator
MTLSLRTRHLEVLLAVAAAGSMQRATQRIHLTQPAISKLVAELETMFGFALFERSKRGVVLTECGHALIERAQFVLNDLDRTREEIAAIGNGTVGLLRIGALSVVESSLLPRSLLALRRIAPALRVQIEEGSRATLLAALRRGEIECVIGRLDVGSAHREFHCELLARMPMHIVVGRKHPLVAKKRIAIADLAAYPWVLPPTGAPIRSVIETLFIGAGLAAPVPVVESTLIRLNYELVRATDLIGVMTEDAASAYAAQRTLAILPIDLSERLPHVGVMMRTSRMSNSMRLLMRVLRETCG